MNPTIEVRILASELAPLHLWHVWDCGGLLSRCSRVRFPGGAQHFDCPCRTAAEFAGFSNRKREFDSPQRRHAQDAHKPLSMERTRGFEPWREGSIPSRGTRRLLVPVEQWPVCRSFNPETGVQLSPGMPNNSTSTDGSDSWLRTMMGKFNSFWRCQGWVAQLAEAPHSDCGG